MRATTRCEVSDLFLGHQHVTVPCGEASIRFLPSSALQQYQLARRFWQSVEIIKIVILQSAMYYCTSFAPAYDCSVLVLCCKKEIMYDIAQPAVHLCVI